MLTRAQIAELRAEIASQRADLDRQDAWLAAEDERLARASAVDTGGTKRIIRTMDVNTHGSPANVKRGAGRATRKHPAQKRLYEKGKTITDVASDLGEGRPRVSSWFADGDANRPIPRRHAEKLRDKYGIPLTAWSRIAD